MDAMEHHGLPQSERTFDVYMISVSAVLLATLFRAFTQVTSNLISAFVSTFYVSVYLQYFL